jgi:predicted nucleic acid-binding protein
MADYLLCDTCTIIDFINGRKHTLQDLLAQDVKLFINSIIEMELLQGARDKNELRVIEKKLRSFRLVMMQQEIFNLATEYVRTYRLSHGLALPDAIIGATAIYYRIPLFTYNTKDFKFLPEIQLADFQNK